MSKIPEILGLYNKLIKISVDTILLWKRGDYKYKQHEIDSCKRDIAFFKSMKFKINNGFYD